MFFTISLRFLPYLYFMKQVDTNNCATIGSGFVEIPNVRLSTASDAVDKAGGVFCGDTLAIPNTILAISQSSGVVSKYSLAQTHLINGPKAYDSKFPTYNNAIMIQCNFDIFQVMLRDSGYVQLQIMEKLKIQWLGSALTMLRYLVIIRAIIQIIQIFNITFCNTIQFPSYKPTYLDLDSVLKL